MATGRHCSPTRQRASSSSAVVVVRKTRISLIVSPEAAVWSKQAVRVFLGTAMPQQVVNPTGSSTSIGVPPDVWADRQTPAEVESPTRAQGVSPESGCRTASGSNSATATLHQLGNDHGTSPDSL